MGTEMSQKASRNLLIKTSFLIIALAVCLRAGGAFASGPRYGGRLVFGAENEFAGFDALKARGFAICDAIANNTVMERLFRLDKAGNLLPVLSLSASSSMDGKQWTITLRQRVSFHDGTAFNADAVVQHWKRILNPENRYNGLSL